MVNIPEKCFYYCFYFVGKKLRVFLNGIKKFQQKSLLWRGRAIIEGIADMETYLSRGLVRSATELPRYKFYTGLIHLILSYGRNYGASILGIVRKIRQGIIMDYQFERKLQSEFFGGLVQFVLIGFMTWIFIFISDSIICAETLFSVRFLVGGLQIFGVVLYFFIYFGWRKKNFLIYSKYFSGLYVLDSLSEVGVSLQLMLEQSGVEKLFEINKRKFCYVDNRLENAIEASRKQGMPIKKELDDIINEVWFLQEQQFGKFVKQMAGLKFVILALFFLSAYFVYLFSLFGHFV